jgi:putative phosphoribosyl transferase
MSLYANRRHAGQVLAAELHEYAGRADVMVVALPRGGVPVAYEIATRLHVPLEVLVVRKLGVPGHPELAMGALAGGGVSVLNDDVVSELAIPETTIAAVIAAERRELARRELAYRHGRPPIDVDDEIVILVDDGLATGSTMRAAIAALKQRGPKRIVVAVPIASGAKREELAELVDDIVCAIAPDPFYAVGFWYDDFAQITDDEVGQLLEAANRGDGVPAPVAGP